VAITITTTARNSRASIVLDAIDAGVGAGYIELRDGTRPAAPSVAASGTLGATITLADPSFPAPTTATTTANAAADVTAAAAITPTWFRVYDSTGAAVFDGSAGATGSGADAIVNPATFEVGQDVVLESLTWTEPDGT
jgi:hypothetical protein